MDCCLPHKCVEFLHSGASQIRVLAGCKSADHSSTSSDCSDCFNPENIVNQETWIFVCCNNTVVNLSCSCSEQECNKDIYIVSQPHYAL